MTNIRQLGEWYGLAAAREWQAGAYASGDDCRTLAELQAKYGDCPRFLRLVARIRDRYLAEWAE